MGIYADSLYF